MSKALKVVRELTVLLFEGRVFQGQGRASRLEESERVKVVNEPKDKIGSLII